MRSIYNNRGLSLIELIVVILVTGILATGTVAFISRTVEGLDSSANRNQLGSVGRIAIDRLAMELHNALPNSIRVSAVTAGNQCIEFVPVRAATSYINPSFAGMGSSEFEVVNFVPTQIGVDGGYAVIFPEVESEIYDGDNGASYATWPDFPNQGPIQTLLSPGGVTAGSGANESTITLVKAHRFNARSPNDRFFIAEQPVSFCVRGDKLYRYSDYGFFATQVTEEESGTCVVTTPARCLPDYAAASASPPRFKSLIADQLDNTGLTAFTVQPQTLTRNALVSIQLNFISGPDSVTLSHEVFVRSVP